MEQTSSLERAVLTGRALNMLAVAAAISAANAYYVQPLLVEIGSSIGLAPSMIGFLPAVAQVGLAFGLLVLLPLADLVSARFLLLVMVPLQITALLMMASASGSWTLAASSFCVGLFGITPYVLPPFASMRVPRDKIGFTTGLLARGVIFGIVLGRTAAGLIAVSFGWRYVYVFAAGAMVLVLALLARTVRPEPTNNTLSYGDTLRSLYHLIKTVPTLRVAALCQALSFGSFNVCWIGLSIYLQQKHAWRPDGVGMVGFLGAFGALLAPRIGKIADRAGAAKTRIVGLAAMTGCWGLFAISQDRLWAMAIVLVAFDVSAAVVDISNRTLLYAAPPEIRSRLNALYQVSMFVGGSLIATFIGVFWSFAGWSGLCCLGALTAASAGAIATRFRKIRA